MSTYKLNICFKEGFKIEKSSLIIYICVQIPKYCFGEQQGHSKILQLFKFGTNTLKPN